MKRHTLGTRLWHWLNLLCVIVLFMSGLTISNAHRYLYWGDAGFSPGEAWLHIVRFPGWATIPGYYDLAAARDWHILFAWPFALGMLAYWLYMVASGHFWRDIRTHRREWRIRAIAADIACHLRLDFGAHDQGYNFLQRLAYGLVLGIFLPGMIFTGLAISPGFEPAAPWLVDILGGRQSARSLHFIFAWALFLFFCLHLLLVLLNRPLHHLGAMITGRLVDQNAVGKTENCQAAPFAQGRRGFLAVSGTFVAGGCTKLAQTRPMLGLFDAAQACNQAAHRTLSGRHALAPEYPRAAISADFRGNGSRTVDTRAYRAAHANGFADWRLEVRGLVEHPLSLTMENIRALPQRTQITRHDCVEGWSAIGEWTGPQLSILLDMAKIQPQARFVVFRCADSLSGGQYYESIDLQDAFHPQTIIAHALNGEPLPEKNGAPLRMRIERQLGYKHAKYLTAIELVSTLADIGGGKGGYWEDHYDYQWYAGM